MGGEREHVYSGQLKIGLRKNQTGQDWRLISCTKMVPQGAECRLKVNLRKKNKKTFLGEGDDSADAFTCRKMKFEVWRETLPLEFSRSRRFVWRGVFS